MMIMMMPVNDEFRLVKLHNAWFLPAKVCIITCLNFKYHNLHNTGYLNPKTT